MDDKITDNEFCDICIHKNSCQVKDVIDILNHNFLNCKDFEL